MYPILFDHGDVQYDKLGKGKLTDVASFVVYEELNGEYTAEFTYPITGPRINDLYEGGTVIVYAPSYNPNNTPETTIDGVMFDIVGHSLAIDGMVTFQCQHLSRRLCYSVMYAGTVNYNFGIYAKPTPNNLDGADISISIPSGNSFTLEEPKSVLACLIGDEQSFKADCGFDFAFYTSVRTLPAKASCNCYAISGGRGADRGAQVRYGYNMMSFDQSIDRRQAFNCVYPYYKGSDGTIVYAADAYHLADRVVTPTTPITPQVCVPLDVSDAFENTPTSAEVATYARAYLDANMPWLAEDEITVSFLNGAVIDPHSPHIELGDTVSVHWADAGITTTQRVISYRYDVLQECYIEMTLGKIPNNFVAVTGVDNYSFSGGGGGGGGGSSALAAYPVGSIYMSVNNTSPAVLFGGTWEQLKDRFLLGTGDNYTAGDTGGEAEHTLTADEIPSHTHGSKSLVGTMNPLAWASSASESGIVSGVQQHTDRVGNSGTNWGDRKYTINATHEHDSVGGGQAHNNMPPYLVVYMWKRTA